MNSYVPIVRDNGATTCLKRMEDLEMEKVLEGIRALDFSRYAAGPYCGMLLADMGADVIKVEKPGGEEDRKLGPFAPNGDNIPYGMILGRNKKGITLNLRSEKGKELLSNLLMKTDVVVHNFTAGSQEGKVLDYESLNAINPGIIVVSITGFGNTGPYAKRPCFDSIAQAMSGGMSYTGFPGQPPTRAGAAYVDFGTGVHAALGTVLALYHRQRTGKGQMVDMAMLDVAVSFVASLGCAAEYKLLGYSREQIGNHSFYNLSDCFETKDGWVMISVIGNGLWSRFVTAMNRDDLKDDPNFSGDMIRFQNRHLLRPIISDWMKERSTDEVVRLLEDARVPCGKVNSIAEMVDNPQVKAREMLVDVTYPNVGPVPLSGVPIKLSETPGGIETRAPNVGEHNKDIYCGLLGITPDELSQLEEEGAI